MTIIIKIKFIIESKRKMIIIMKKKTTKRINMKIRIKTKIKTSIKMDIERSIKIENTTKIVETSIETVLKIMKAESIMTTIKNIETKTNTNIIIIVIITKVIMIKRIIIERTVKKKKCNTIQTSNRNIITTPLTNMTSIYKITVNIISQMTMPVMYISMKNRIRDTINIIVTNKISNKANKLTRVMINIKIQ